MGGGGKKTPVTLPPQLAKVLEKPGAQWYLFQVQPSLDWCTWLEGARLRLTPAPTLLAPQSAKPICARVAEQQLHQLMPLQPSRPGSHKLHVVQGVQPLIQICEATPELLQADAAVCTAADEEAGAETKRAAMQSRARAEVARRRAETRERCHINPLDEVFASFGLGTEQFSLALAQDDWNGQGAEPVAVVAAKAQQATEEESSLHLKPVALDHGGVFSVPLACWRLGLLTPEASAKLVFRHYLVFSGKHQNSQLLGQCDDAPLMLARGTRAKKPSPMDFKYLVGGQAAGSRRVHIFEAELFQVEPDKFADPSKDASDYEEEGAAAAAPEAEETLSYWEQRRRMTSTFGVAKRQRDTARATEKAQKRQFMELEQYASELSERVQSQEANLVDVAERAEAKRRKMLPPYNPAASHPSEIYKDGLDSIAPRRCIQAEASLQNPELSSLLKQSAVQLARLCETSNAIQSKLLAAALTTKARSGAVGSADFATRCEVLNRLTRIYLKAPKLVPPVAKVKTVANMADLPLDSALTKHWHQSFFDEIPGRVAERSLNAKKMLAAMIVWALHLTPGLALELDGSAAEIELKLPNGALEVWLRNIGCTIVHADRAPGSQGPIRMVATLSSPPKMDMERYEHQNRLSSSKKKGRGKGGRG